ncbi:unnamed protein product [Chironomus riparius]|uniref:BTB domain-containing protein n=1 Tax=Chironomus riparius TaxID=315576 RepID=A0A9N9WN60_9DIPT|nr:unnamed protein product [Chironomus riparius]
MKQLICEFKYDPYIDGRILYACFIKNQQIPADEELEFTGRHVSGHSNNNVIDVIFENCDIKKVPQGLTKVFPKMQDLSVWSSNLKKVTKNDLKEYKNLLRFGFCNNEIEFLFGDLFEGFDNVQEVIFSGNEGLKFVEPNILDGLENLNMVNFTGNLKYFKRFSSVQGDLGNATLAEVKAELWKNFCIDPENIKNAYQKHKEEIAILKTFITASDKENQKLKKKEKLLQKQIQESEEREKKLLNDLKIEKAEHSMLKMSSKNDISKEIKQLLMNDNFKDFTVIIDDREFRVHKFLLIARSSTLAEILRNNPQVESLNLIDIPIEIFEKVLKFLYFEEITLEIETNFLQLFAAAGRLKIEKLKTIVASNILNQITADNALEILSLSNKYENDELRTKSFAEIKKTFPKLILNDDWAFNTEKVKKTIDLFKEKEEAIKRIEQKFWSEMKNN